MSSRDGGKDVEEVCVNTALVCEGSEKLGLGVPEVLEKSTGYLSWLPGGPLSALFLARWNDLAQSQCEQVIVTVLWDCVHILGSSVFPAS